MARKRLMARLSGAVLATFAVLIAAALLSMLLRGPIGGFGDGVSVQASPRGMFAIDGPLRLSKHPDLVLTGGRLSAEALDWQSLQSPRLVLDGATLVLQTSAAATPEPAAPQAPAVSDALSSLMQRLAFGGFESLKIRGGSLVVRSGAVSGETLTDIEADVTSGRKGVVSAKGSFSLRGMRMDFDGAAGPNPDKGAGEASALPARLSIRSAALDATIDGQLPASGPFRFEGQAEIAVPRLSRLGPWLGIELAETAVLRNVSIKSGINWSKSTIALEKTSVSMDGQSATGALSFGYRAQRPSIEGTLAFAALDLKPYLDAALPATAPAGTLAGNWPTIDAAAPVIRHADLDLRVSTSRLDYGGQRLGRGAATVSVRAGKLHADIAELELNDVRSTMQVSIDMTDTVPRYTLRGRLDMANAGPFAAHLFGRDVLTGRSTATVDLAGSGPTLGSILRGASGKVGLVSGEGARLGVDLKALRPHAKEAGRDLSRAGWGALASDQTGIDALELKANVLNGSAVVHKSHVRAGSLSYAATGRVDFLARQMDLQLRPHVTKTTPGLPADPKAIKAKPAGEADVMVLRGAWERPTISIDDNRRGSP